MDELKPTACPNVLTDGRYMYSRNLVPGKSVYGERLLMVDGVEYRLWDPGRSKLAAHLLLSEGGGDIRQNDVFLYLGASTGTTVSHVSDITVKGQIYAIEISKRTFRELINNVSARSNILPMLGNARDENLMEGILTHADYIYCDIAQPDQVQIFLTNMIQYSCRSGLLMLKCKSIDVTASPKSLMDKAVNTIKGRGFHIEPPIDIGAYEKDHYALLVRKVKK